MKLYKSEIYCKECEVKVHTIYCIWSCKTYIFCPKCKTHEVIYRHDDINKFYTVKLL